VLLDPWPIIAIGALAWLVAAVAAFVVPAWATWRPLTLAGLAVGVLGTSIFLWQRAAARRGSRGAQTGLTTTPTS
jgi:Flp pilus assembly protein TadB